MNTLREWKETALTAQDFSSLLAETDSSVPVRYDSEQKWAKAYGTASTETRAQRIMRHARGIGEWTRFASKTLLR